MYGTYFQNHPVTILLHLSSHYRFDGVTALKIDGGYRVDLISSRLLSSVRVQSRSLVPLLLFLVTFSQGPRDRGGK